MSLVNRFSDDCRFFFAFILVVFFVLVIIVLRIFRRQTWVTRLEPITRWNALDGRVTSACATSLCSRRCRSSGQSCDPQLERSV